jgi:predicted MFS family arabinose efflux permease
LATLPTTVLLTALSRPFGALADRLGPRVFMGAGPLVMAGGLLLLVRVEQDVEFTSALLPALVTFSVGLAMTVAPLTAMVLAGVDEQQAGIASAVNNAAARIAGLVGIAALGPLVGSQLDVAAFHVAAVAAATLVAAAGVLGGVLVRNPQRVVRAAECSGGPLAGAPRDAAVRELRQADQGVGQGPHGREPAEPRAMVRAR